MCGHPYLMDTFLHEKKLVQAKIEIVNSSHIKWIIHHDKKYDIFRIVMRLFFFYLIYSEDDMVVDCIDILTSLAQTEEGSIKLVDYGSITALSEVITKQLRGRSVLCYLYNIVLTWNSYCLLPRSASVM